MGTPSIHCGVWDLQDHTPHPALTSKFSLSCLRDSPSGIWFLCLTCQPPAPTFSLFLRDHQYPSIPHIPFLHPRPFMGMANSGRRSWDSHCAADPKRLHRPQGPLWVERVQDTRAYQQYVTVYENHGSAESRKSSLRNNLNLQAQGNLLDCLLVMNL